MSSKGQNHDRNQDKFRNNFDVDRRSYRSRFQPFERVDVRGNKGFSHRKGSLPIKIGPWSK